MQTPVMIYVSAIMSAKAQILGRSLANFYR